jgi:hypothetical protein
MIYVEWWIFFHVRKNSKLGEMEPTCELPITKFASTLCLTPTYVQGQKVSHCVKFFQIGKISRYVTLISLTNSLHSLLLNFILENHLNFREMKLTCGLPITKFASTLCLKPTYTSQGNITAVFLFDNKHDSYRLDIFTLVL